MCEHRMWDEPDGLLCNRTDPHLTGHIYLSRCASHLGEGAHHFERKED